MLDLSGSTIKMKEKAQAVSGQLLLKIVIRINSLCPVSSVADEDAYIRGGIVNEVKEEPFGEQWMKKVTSNNGFHSFCHHSVHLFVEEEGEVLEVIDMQNESFSE